MKNELSNLRIPKPGDLCWITKVHGEYYAEKFGWLSEFECIIAKIIFDYLNSPTNVKQACFVAEINHKRAGCVMLREKSKLEGQLRVMFVSPEARGKGIGTTLIQATLKKAREFGYTSLYLITTNNQVTARKLYRKVGFKLISTSPNTTFAKGSTDEQWQLIL